MAVAPPAPPSIETRTITSYIVIGLTLTAVAVLSWRISHVFVVAFGGIVLATVLRSMSEPLSRHTRLSDRGSLVVVLLILLLSAGVLTMVFGNLVMGQVGELREKLPVAMEEFTNSIGKSDMGAMMLDSFEKSMTEGTTWSGFGLAAGAALSLTADLILLLFLGVYFAVDPKLYRSGALRLLPPKRRAQVRSALDDAAEALRKWVLAQLAAMVAVGVLTGVALTIIGVPMAFALAVLAGLLEFVPIVGPIFAAIPALLLAFAHGPSTLVYTAGAYVVVQQIESNLITPLVQRWAVKLAPVVGLLSVLACGYIFGVIGIIFATPIAVVVVELVKHLYVEDTLENNAPPAPSISAKAARG